MTIWRMRNLWRMRDLWRMRIAYWIPKTTHSLTTYNTHRFSTTTMVARTRLNVTPQFHCLSCSFPSQLRLLGISNFFSFVSIFPSFL